MTFQAHGGWRSKSFANKDPLVPLRHYTALYRAVGRSGNLLGGTSSNPRHFEDFASIPAKIRGSDCLLRVDNSEKATKFCEIFTLLLSYVAPVKSKMKIAKILWPSQNIWTLPPFPSSNGPAALVLVLPIHIMYLHFCSKKFCLSTWRWLSFVSSLNFFLIWLCLLTWKIKK